MHHHTPPILPTPKKGFRPERIGYPFPNFLLTEHEVPSVCRCLFDGDSFYVLNSKDMHILNHHGSFGVSSLTFRGPSDEEPSFFMKPYFAKKLERQSSSSTNFKLVDASELCSTTAGSGTGSGSGSFCRSNGHSVKSESRSPSSFNNSDSGSSIGSLGKLDVPLNRTNASVSSSGVGKGSHHSEQLGVDGDEKEETVRDMDGLRNMFLQTLKCNIEEERLILMPEEAIFLSFGVGCLTIHGPGGSRVGVEKVWKKLVDLNPDFPISYAVYHYFRSKNWVPKIGDSYGASYLLYKIGPSAFHASYLVHILGFPSRPTPTWNDLNAWVRLGCHVSKNVLLCEVSLPKRFDVNTSKPKSIFDMSLKETSLFRWKASSGTLIKF